MITAYSLKQIPIKISQHIYFTLKIKQTIYPSLKNAFEAKTLVDVHT